MKLKCSICSKMIPKQYRWAHTYYHIREDMTRARLNTFTFAERIKLLEETLARREKFKIKNSRIIIGRHAHIIIVDDLIKETG